MEIGTKKPTIYVNMLGEFSITINDKKINESSNQSKKPWCLLEYLITFRNREIPPNELIELIWSNDESSNPGGALKTLLFRSRKLLTPLDYPPQNLIVLHRGSYAWTKDMETVVDADLFEQMANKALDSQTDPEDQLDYCLDAIDIYKGDFLPKSEWESWVVPISTYYHSLYLKIVLMAVDILKSQGNYQKIIDICQRAIAVEQFDENLHYNLIYSLYKSGNQHSAMEHYNHTVDMFYNEFAITPSPHLKELYNIIRDTKHGITTDLTVIQDILREDSDVSGAFYCEYAVFRDIYQLESRAIERTGDSIFLCLLTITDINGNLLKQSVLTKAMDELNTAICRSLRRGDVYSRYSVSQYMILLPTSTYENGEMVLKRISQNFRKKYTRKDLVLNYSLQAVQPNK